MAINQQPDPSAGVFKLFSTRRILIPILLGLAVVGYFLAKDFDAEQFAQIEWGLHSLIGLGFILLFMVFRQLGYMIRIKILSDGQLTWKQSFDIISIWEFASAVTPSIIGGTAVAMFLLAKEKINLGKSTAITLLTAFFDELYFIIFAPLIFFIAGRNAMFPFKTDCIDNLDIPIISSLNDLIVVFLIGYVILLVYTVLIGYGLFINPLGLKKVLFKLFSIKLLKKWRKKAVQTGTEVIIASVELKGKKFSFWIKSFLATTMAWLSRYLVVNCVLFIFFMMTTGHFTVLARQFVLWIIMMLPLTPGASGIAEATFVPVLCEFIPLYKAEIIFSWRLFTYFPYLILGVIVFPRWLKKIYYDPKSL